MSQHSFSEYRDLAWQRLMKEGWLMRLVGGGIVLSLCERLVQAVVGGMLVRLNVPSWSSYAEAAIRNRMTLTTPVPNLTTAYIRQATSGTLLELFFIFIMCGITAYGTAVILRKCLRGEATDWLKAAFGGFRMPFGLLALYLRYGLIWLGWTLLALLPTAVVAAGAVWLPRGAGEPGLAATAAVYAVFSLASGCSVAILCVPFYRYRFLFLVKADDPDLPAGECLSRCRRLTDGRKWESFKLDCSFWKPILLVLVVPLAVSFGCVAFGGLGGGSGAVFGLCSAAAVLTALAACAGVFVLGVYIHAAQGFFYRDLASSAEPPPSAPPSAPEA